MKPGAQRILPPALPGLLAAPLEELAEELLELLRYRGLAFDGLGGRDVHHRPAAGLLDQVSEAVRRATRVRRRRGERYVRSMNSGNRQEPVRTTWALPSAESIGYVKPLIHCFALHEFPDITLQRRHRNGPSRNPHHVAIRGLNFNTVPL